MVQRPTPFTQFFDLWQSGEYARPLEALRGYDGRVEMVRLTHLRGLALVVVPGLCGCQHSISFSLVRPRATSWPLPTVHQFPLTYGLLISLDFVILIFPALQELAFESIIDHP
jgi:hypothetical protein